MRLSPLTRRPDRLTPFAILAGGAMMAASVVAPGAGFWMQVPALVLLGAGGAGFAAAFAPPARRSIAAATALAVVLGLLAWALPDHRDWAWGIAALAALFVMRSVLPCGACAGGTCSSRSIPGYRFPPGH